MKLKTIPFNKMHGLGNDFVVINALDHQLDLAKISIPNLADRHIGIGFDQLLLLEPSKQADFFCRIYNSDGSEAEQCGNGLRCLARYIHEQGLNKNLKFKLETRAGIFPIEIKDYAHISVSMGAPQMQHNLIDLNLSDNLNKIPVSILSLGNPHAIAKVDSLELSALTLLAPQIAAHAFFPQGVNVGFMQILNRNQLRLRTFERGAGETHACGSNACAAAVAGIANGWVESQVHIDFKYGSLEIEWEGNSHPIKMTGPASNVYAGALEIEPRH